MTDRNTGRAQGCFFTIMFLVVLAWTMCEVRCGGVLINKPLADTMREERARDMQKQFEEGKRNYERMNREQNEAERKEEKEQRSESQ